MTHADLVKKAEGWLKRRCGVVFTEHTGGREFPDAIGWRGGVSTVIECKVSRADFCADLRKRTRKSYDVRPGFHCYYLTPKDLLYCHDEVIPYLFRELPDGWGLLELDAHGRIRVTRKPRPEALDDRTVDQLRDEVYRLYCEIRRYQAQGLKPKTYAAFVASTKD